MAQFASVRTRTSLFNNPPRREVLIYHPTTTTIKQLIPLALHPHHPNCGVTLPLSSTAHFVFGFTPPTHRFPILCPDKRIKRPHDGLVQRALRYLAPPARPHPNVARRAKTISQRREPAGHASRPRPLGRRGDASAPYRDDPDSKKRGGDRFDPQQCRCAQRAQ